MNHYIPWIHEKKKKEVEQIPLYKELENPAFYIPRKEEIKEDPGVIIIELCKSS